jgi:response regulator of citrate/malate metabolism
MFAFSIKLILSDSSIKGFIGTDLLKESLNNTRKEVIILVQSCKDTKQVLICQETLFEAFI